MDISHAELLERLGVALALGLLVGAERGWHTRELAEGRRVAGLRTFGLIGLLGGVWAVLAPLAGPLVLAVAFLALVAILTVAYWQSLKTDADRGATSHVAALLTFAFGALAGFGELEVGAAAAVVVTLLLGIKAQLHGLIERISREELMAVIKLLLMSVVLLPVLPDRGYGPWQALNPYQIWWMVVLIAGLSFVGYAAIRILGPRRGIALSGLLGGLASSTAATLNFARMGRREPAHRALLAAGTVIACAMMFARVLVVIAVVAPKLVEALLWPLLLGAIVCSGLGALALGRDTSARPKEPLRLQNPFELGVALKFGLLLAAIMVVSSALIAWAGSGALYALAATAGLADVDAITLSFGSMGQKGTLAPRLAASGILLAVAVNSALKAGLAAAIGGPAMGWRVGTILALALAAAAGGLWLPMPSDAVLLVP